MDGKHIGALLSATLLLCATGVFAQETSRVIPFNGVTTTLPPDTTQDVTVQLWDAATGGTLLFSEAQPGLAVDDNGTISFLFGSLTGGGLNPAIFPSGSSRFLDVVDATSASVLAARLPLNATSFALSPGPQGPQGDPGPPGPPGTPGIIQTVTGADSSIAVSGTPADRAIAVAANGIGNTHIANGALNPFKIAGTAATLGANTFFGQQQINTTNSNGVSSTSNSGTGVLGETDGGTTVAGVQGVSLGLDGKGVWGEANNGTAIGVYGTTTSTSSTGGYGVYGTSTIGTGVYGTSFNGTGVFGSSNSGKAGDFHGNVQVTGMLSKGGGMFHIDHLSLPKTRSARRFNCKACHAKVLILQAK